jgi:hypothetical protein
MPKNQDAEQHGPEARSESERGGELHTYVSRRAGLYEEGLNLYHR